MTEQERAEERRKGGRLLAALGLLREFTERPSIKQIVRNPFIHALVLSTVFSAGVLYLTYAGQDHGVAVGARSLAVAAVLAGLTVFTGLQWRNPVVGRGIESFGHLLLAAVWIGNNVILYYQPPGPVQTGWAAAPAMVIPTLFCLASLVRVLDLYLTTEVEKVALGVSSHLHDRAGVAGHGSG